MSIGRFGNAVESSSSFSRLRFVHKSALTSSQPCPRAVVVHSLTSIVYRFFPPIPVHGTRLCITLLTNETVGVFRLHALGVPRSRPTDGSRSRRIHPVAGKGLTSGRVARPGGFRTDRAEMADRDKWYCTVSNCRWCTLLSRYACGPSRGGGFHNNRRTGRTAAARRTRIAQPYATDEITTTGPKKRMKSSVTHRRGRA